MRSRSAAAPAPDFPVAGFDAFGFDDELAASGFAAPDWPSPARDGATAPPLVGDAWALMEVGAGWEASPAAAVLRSWHPATSAMSATRATSSTECARDALGVRLTGVFT